MTYLAVLLTCHNRREKTLACLTNLFECKLPEGHSLDVFLVDDGSTDGTSEAIAKQFPQVRLIQGSGDLFWNRGMHLAWKTATEHKAYDYYLWLNDDTFILDEAIAEVIECSRASEETFLVCGAVCSRTNGQFTYGGRVQGGEVIPNGSVQSCNEINGNCVLVPAEVYQTAGMLDPIFPHAIGDYEYGFRVQKHGFKVVTTRKYIGYCERNEFLPKWCYSDVPFLERLKVLYSPLGNSHPYYYFIYEKRHHGLGVAIFHFLTIHLRVLSPKLWGALKNEPQAG